MSAHPFANATLADFLDALDGATDRDIRGWAADWLRTTGYDTIRVDRDGDVPVLVREGSRPHRLTVTAYDDDLAAVGERLVDLSDEPVRLDDFAGRAVIPNSRDETYAALWLDERSWSALASGPGRIAEPLTRALLWATAAAQVEHGQITPAELVDWARGLADEAHPVVFEGAMDLTLGAVRRYARPEDLPHLLPPLADVARRTLADRDARAAAAARVLASVSDDPELLAAWLDGSADLPAADQDVRWLILRRLASLGDDSRLDAEAERDRSTSGELGLLRARAAVPTEEAKADAWRRLMSGDLSNREFEAVGAGFWGWEQGDLVAPYLVAYVRDGVALGRRTGQAFGKVIGSAFPWLPLPDDWLRELRDALAGALEGNVPTVLARTWNDRLDDLDLVIRARDTDGQPVGTQ